MSPSPPGTPGDRAWYGPPSGDPLAARLFPPLPGRVLWGLDRMHRIMAAAGSPHRRYPSMVVGGTNGKGSVAHLWARVLEASGRRVGLFTSPHLLHFRERIQVDGEPLPDGFLEEIADELRSPIVKRQPSFFEATTALALTAFARMEVDVAVLEVGLGGRLDAVNIVDPIVTAVTNVELDHVAMLGADHATIAREKAGIFRPGVPAFTATTHPDALRVLAEEAAELGIPLHRVGAASGTSQLLGDDPGTWLDLRTRSWGDLRLHTSLLGSHQRTNVALAVRSLEGLPPRLLPPRRAVVDGVASTRIPGRLQLLEAGGVRHLLDVAHNPDGVRALVRALEELQLPRPRVAVVGILSDKPTGAMLEALAPAVDRILLTVPPSAPLDRRWDPDQEAETRGGVEGPDRTPLEPHPDLGAALRRGAELAGRADGGRGTGGGTVIVTGSFYTVGGALERLQGARRG